MTEEDWLAATDPTPMLEFLRGKVGDRKLRLFSVACCRRLWPYLDDEKGRPALEAAEQGADGGVYGPELWAALGVTPWNHDELHTRIAERCNFGQEMALAVYRAVTRSMDVRECTEAIGIVVLVAHVTGAQALSRRSEDYLLYQGGKDVLFEDDELAVAEQAAAVAEAEQVMLIHDIFGNPFRPTVFKPEWRTSTAVTIAAQMYETRDFSALPILADSLQDAGCADEDVLSHCRGLGPHVRGYWVVDLVLGKE